MRAVLHKKETLRFLGGFCQSPNNFLQLASPCGSTEHPPQKIALISLHLIEAKKSLLSGDKTETRRGVLS